MRAIYLAQLDKTRPVLVLTADRRRSSLRTITIATITTTVRGSVAEVKVGSANGLDHDCVVNCDDIYTIPGASLGRFVGVLQTDQESALARALIEAFDLSADIDGT